MRYPLVGIWRDEINKIGCQNIRQIQSILIVCPRKLIKSLKYTNCYVIIRMHFALGYAIKITILFCPRVMSLVGLTCAPCDHFETIIGRKLFRSVC
uniref:Uncharacterized protein n=1 Tax=Pararge aegeria TaxID=116150 RepID=S4P0Q2_9NEOP